MLQMHMPRILTQILFMGVPITLLCFSFLGFWYVWKKVCPRPQPRRDFLVLILVPFLSPLMLGITFWHFPEQGGNWNIWVIVLPFIVSIAMFSYSAYSIANGRYRLLSTLGMLASGQVALLEGIAASVLILSGRAN
jgi:hypothetical protein